LEDLAIRGDERQSLPGREPDVEGICRAEPRQSDDGSLRRSAATATDASRTYFIVIVGSREDPRPPNHRDQPR
jgi:hypothetical protein